MGFSGCSPGIRKYFVAAGFSYLRDFVITGFDCTVEELWFVLREAFEKSQVKLLKATLSY